MINILFVFIGSLILDIIWVLWVKEIGEKHATRAGLFSLLTVITSGIIIVEYVGDPKLLIVAGLGSFAGTYLSIKVSSEDIKQTIRTIRVYLLHNLWK